MPSTSRCPEQTSNVILSRVKEESKSSPDQKTEACSQRLMNILSTWDITWQVGSHPLLLWLISTNIFKDSVRVSVLWQSVCKAWPRSLPPTRISNIWTFLQLKQRMNVYSLLLQVLLFLKHFCPYLLNGKCVIRSWTMLSVTEGNSDTWCRKSEVPPICQATCYSSSQVLWAFQTLKVCRDRMYPSFYDMKSLICVYEKQFSLKTKYRNLVLLWVDMVAVYWLVGKPILREISLSQWLYVSQDATPQSVLFLNKGFMKALQQSFASIFKEQFHNSYNFLLNTTMSCRAVQRWLIIFKPIHNGNLTCTKICWKKRAKKEQFKRTTLYASVEDVYKQGAS